MRQTVEKIPYLAMLSRL